MRTVKLAALAAAAAWASGCTSYVRTYDAQGALLGSCVARRGLLFGGGTSCVGSANPKDQR